jgi:hypothetical protein
MLATSREVESFKTNAFIMNRTIDNTKAVDKLFNKKFPKTGKVTSGK